MSARPEPSTFDYEPRYPDHETVVIAWRRPDWCVHRPSTRCGIEAPHATVECGEFAPSDAKEGEG